MARRYGSGGVRRRSDGRWEGQLRLADGTRKYVYARNRRELITRLQEERWRLACGLPVRARGLSLAAYAAQWLEVMRCRLRPTTFAGHELCLRRALSRLGSVPIARLTPQLIQACYAGLLADGLSARTVFHTHAGAASRPQSGAPLGTDQRHPVGERQHRLSPPRPGRRPHIAARAAAAAAARRQAHVRRAMRHRLVSSRRGRPLTAPAALDLPRPRRSEHDVLVSVRGTAAGRAHRRPTRHGRGGAGMEAARHHVVDVARDHRGQRLVQAAEALARAPGEISASPLSARARTSRSESANARASSSARAALASSSTTSGTSQPMTAIR